MKNGASNLMIKVGIISASKNRLKTNYKSHILYRHFAFKVDKTRQ